MNKVVWVLSWFWVTSGGMEKRSWACTVFTQVCICASLFVAFHLGHLREETKIGYYGMLGRGGGGGGGNGDGEVGNDVYFITVRGDVRAEDKQNRVLKLMEKVARSYRVEFVVDVTEDGEHDVLLQKGTQYYRSLKIPWYTTKASTRGEHHYIQLIEIALGKTLTLIGLDVGYSKGLMSAIRNEQPQRVVRALMEANSQWNVYVRLHPVISCHNNSGRIEAKELLDSQNDGFPKYGVNAYLSGRTCADCAHQGGINYIANLDPWNKSTDSASFLSRTLATAFCQELEDGILLHRVNAEEIATYFINLSLEESYGIIIQKRGRGVM